MSHQGCKCVKCSEASSICSGSIWKQHETVNNNISKAQLKKISSNKTPLRSCAPINIILCVPNKPWVNSSKCFWIKKKEALSCLWVSPSTSQHAFYFSIHLIISAFYSPPIYDPKQALTRKMTSYRLFSGVQCSKITRRPAKGKTGGTCFFATVFPRWSCGGSCVIGDLINRWICCIAIPGRELLPEQPHHKHCRLMVGNYDLLVATCARTDCWINFELSVGVARCEQ